MFSDNPLVIVARQAKTYWTRQEDLLFEQALFIVPDETPDRWQKIAEQVPGRSAVEIAEHYEALLYDVNEIDSGRTEWPDYNDELVDIPCWDSGSQVSFGIVKKGIAWSEEEHMLFLLGLQIYGKGDWRSISRNVVLTRTPTQVASHAQKYFLRQSLGKKERKRSSIHDITTVKSKETPPPVDQNRIPLANVPMHQTQELQQQWEAQNQMPPAIPMQQNRMHPFVPRQELEQLNPLTFMPDLMGGLGCQDFGFDMHRFD